ncbi:hypothetical protein GCM10010466_03500 [Planomonospora alba]|uniref:Uncharacterized protein n=1 Tax=Planomonospora alba TaxID=161354 RepID=A0ABP6MIK9_9ACTN
MLFIHAARIVTPPTWTWGIPTEYKYTPEILAEAAANSRGIADVLRCLGVKWTGGSHAHISRRLEHFGIDTSHFLGQAHRRGQTSPIGAAPIRFSSFSPQEALAPAPGSSGGA